MANVKDYSSTAFAYYRTSSASNVGADKDSERRQREAVRAFAAGAGITVIGEFYDAAVSGADHLDERAGFSAMLERIAANGCRTIIVETASRFARDLLVQEVGFARLQAEGITLIAADSPSSFQDTGPSTTLIRQMLGAVAEFDRAMTVAKLKGARDRKRRETGKKVEGRKSATETNPEAAALAKRLRRQSRVSHHRMPIRKIADELARLGHLAPSGKPFSYSVVRRMVQVSESNRKAP